jgi:hypothetical protein
MELLDARRKGEDMPESVVLAALSLTGDYEPASRYVQPEFKRLFEVA